MALTKERRPVIIGLDMGSSATKIVGCTPEGALMGTLHLEGRATAGDPFAGVRRFLEKYRLGREDIAAMAATGVGSVGLTETFEGIPVAVADEFQSIARGALALTGLSDAVIVNMGTGTVLIRAEGQTVRHLGGSGVGGGTLAGLCRHFYGVEGTASILARIAEGDLDRVDLHIRDLVSDDGYVLGGDLTASNFGKITPDAAEGDMMLGFLNLIFESVGMMAAFACSGGGVTRVVLTGALATLPQAAPRFALIQELTGVEFVIPPDALFATALGAVLSTYQM